MTTTSIARIGELLSRVGAPGTFSSRRTAAADDLHLEVKGLGRLRFPISRTQAQRLCRMARPARYGRREQTLLDTRVRDTWEIPKSRVKIDQRQWKRTASLALAYERVLRLVDLTVEVQSGRNLRRELLRWRDLIAELYLRPDHDPAAHAAAFRCLLLFTPVAARQIPHVLAGSRADKLTSG